MRFLHRNPNRALERRPLNLSFMPLLWSLLQSGLVAINLALLSELDFADTLEMHVGARADQSKTLRRIAGEAYGWGLFRGRDLGLGRRLAPPTYKEMRAVLRKVTLFLSPSRAYSTWSLI